MRLGDRALGGSATGDVGGEQLAAHEGQSLRPLVDQVMDLGDHAGGIVRAYHADLRIMLVAGEAHVVRQHEDDALAPG